MGKNLDVVLSSLEAAHKLNVDGALSYYAPDASYRFGNFPTVTGVPAIRKNLYDTHVDIMRRFTGRANHREVQESSGQCGAAALHRRNARRHHFREMSARSWEC